MLFMQMLNNLAYMKSISRFATVNYGYLNVPLAAFMKDSNVFLILIVYKGITLWTIKFIIIKSMLLSDFEEEYYIMYCVICVGLSVTLYYCLYVSVYITKIYRLIIEKIFKLNRFWKKISSLEIIKPHMACHIPL